jgi:hypothetical protein
VALRIAPVRELIVAILAFGIIVEAGAQNLILNGGFEQPGLPSNEQKRFLANESTFVAGWNVIDDGVGEQPFYVRRPFSEAVLSGEYGILLNQGSGLRTTFRARPDTFYELSLWIRPSECTQCQSPAPMRVMINQTRYILPLVSGWSQQRIQFWATNSVNTLEILNPSSPADYKQYGVDDVSVMKVNGATLNIRMYPGVLIEGFPGERYEVQATTDLNAPSWVTVTNILLTNSPVLFIDMDPKRPLDYPPKERRIYRTVQVPP